MDPFQQHDAHLARTESPAARLQITLALMQDGIDLEHFKLQQAHPTESPDQIQARLLRWLMRE